MRHTPTLFAFALLSMTAACAGTQSMHGHDAAPTGHTSVVPKPTPDPIPDPDPVPDPVPDPDPAAVRAKLAQLRDVQVQRLRDYSARAAFPRNTYAAGQVNVFIDEDGNICAAANLIALSGNMDLVRQTAATNNFIALRDVHDGELYDWMLTSGLTQEEIALIQEPYWEEPSDPQQIGQFRDSETERLQQHFALVDETLAKSTEASLDLIMERLADRPDLARALLAS